MPPPRQPATAYRRALVVVLTILAGLLAAAIGFATNLASVLIDDRWVHDHGMLVVAVLGGLVVASGIVAGWLVVAARRAEASQDSTAASQAGGAVAGGSQRVAGATMASGDVHQHGPVAQTGTAGAGAATTAIGTLVAQGPVNFGSPPVSAPPVPAPPATPSLSSGRAGALPPRNPHFTGRTDLLDQLHHTLTGAGGQPAALVAAHGLGGIGKTQLALEYAHRHADTYRLRWWIPAATRLGIAQGLTLLAPTLGLPEEADLEAAAAAVRAELAGRDGWLLIFDNVDDPADLHPYLPPSNSGRVLVTSRNPAVGLLGPRSRSTGSTLPRRPGSC